MLSFVFHLRLKILKKAGQFFRAEIRQNFSIHVQHWREFLAGNLHHLIKCAVIRHHVNLLVSDVVVIEPAHRLVTPTAIRLDE